MRAASARVDKGFFVIGCVYQVVLDGVVSGGMQLLISHGFSIAGMAHAENPASGIDFRTRGGQITRWVGRAVEVPLRPGRG